nr:MAG TPA: hypothetical protein [Caudoviricetes sp.]
MIRCIPLMEGPIFWDFILMTCKVWIIRGGS